MPSKKIVLKNEQYGDMFLKYHSINTRYAEEILNSKFFSEMQEELQNYCGLEIVNATTTQLTFEIKNKNKYLMAKIIYGI